MLQKVYLKFHNAHPQDKNVKVWIDFKDGLDYEIIDHEPSPENTKYFEPMHIYFSNTSSELLKNDWYLQGDPSPLNDEDAEQVFGVYQYRGGEEPHGYAKILATTNPLLGLPLIGNQVTKQIVNMMEDFDSPENIFVDCVEENGNVKVNGLNAIVYIFDNVKVRLSDVILKWQECYNENISEQYPAFFDKLVRG